MCAIVDASVAGLVFTVPYRPEYLPLWRWIEKKDGKIVYGGKLADELNRVPEAKRLLFRLKQAGLARLCSPQNVNNEETFVRKQRLCRSNDPHVIALARISGARVLCTNDRDLEKDFKNPQLVPSPQGKIYKNANHERMLGHNHLCRRFISRKQTPSA